MSADPRGTELERRVRVLVAEDEPNIRQYVIDILSGHEEIELRLVPNGEEALAALQENDWDIVLTDQRMGVTDGIAVLGAAAKIRPKARRVMMTGFAEVPLVESALNEARVERFLAKPFSPTDLSRVVAALVEAVRAQRNHDGAFERAIETTSKA